MTPHRKPISLYIKSEEKSSIFWHFWHVFFTFFYYIVCAPFLHKTEVFFPEQLPVIRYCSEGRKCSKRHSLHFLLSGAVLSSLHRFTAGFSAAVHTEYSQFSNTSIVHPFGYMSGYFLQFCVIFPVFFFRSSEKTVPDNVRNKQKKRQLSLTRSRLWNYSATTSSARYAANAVAELTMKE